MSLEGFRWAWTVPVHTPAQRLVLVAYGNAHRKGSRVAWLGLDRLTDETLLDRKTASAARLALTDHPDHGQLGYLSDTGARRGTTGKVAVFRLNFERTMPLGNDPENGPIEPVDNAAQPSRKRDDSNGAIVPKTEGNSPENGPTTPLSDSEPVPEPVQALARASQDQGEEPHIEPGPRVEGFEHPIEKIRRQHPHMFTSGATSPAAYPVEDLDS